MDFKKLEYHLDNLKVFDIKEYDLCVKLNGKEIFRKMDGFADYNCTKAVNKDSLRWIYSMTKIVTAITILRLAEKNVLSIDDEVAKYLPEYGFLNVIDKNGVKPAQNKLLIWHLLAMQSGMNYDINSPYLSDARKNKNASTRELVRAMAKEPLQFEPGTDALYSLSHDVLAAVAEVATNKSWLNILQDEIFTPLDITDIGFHPNAEQKKRFTQQYLYDENFYCCNVTGMENPFMLSDNYESAGAGLFCSTDSYSKIIDALANDGVAENEYVVLKKESIDLMRKNRIKDNKWFCNKLGYGYGLGVRVLVDRNLARTCTGDNEFGWDGAASSYNLIDPQNHISIVFSTHIRGTQLLNSVLSPQTCNLVYESLGLATPYIEK